MMETKTKWEKIISGDKLAKVIKTRSKTYVEKKERRSALPELIEEGWIEYKNYKDPKWIGVKKDKKFDEVFEDRVWTLFAKLGYKYMNEDRNFEMSYDMQHPNSTQQIDVFAADDETVLIVECKASEMVKKAVFKKNIEALHGQMEGLRKEAKKKFKNAKVKFIWATDNCIISRADQEKLEEWDIIHFDAAVINYYYELVKHLGTCARYQLLGNLFAFQEINNMEDKVPAIQGDMGGHKYYAFSIEPERLLKIGYVLHRNEANQNIMPTYQRIIKKGRLTSVRTFINNGGYFPNSVIINIDTKGRDLNFDLSPVRVDNSLSRLGILHLPKKYRSAYIIDGQHRLYGYSDSEYAVKNTIPVVAFINLERQEQIKLFMDINENQKAVPKTLRVTLNADMLWDSKDYNERRQALRSKIAQMLGEESTSPLLSRVLIGEEERTNTKCITVEAIQQALKKCDFLTTYDKKNVIVKNGTFDLGDNQKTCDLLYPFLEQCFLYVYEGAKDEWELGESDTGIVTINRGIHAILCVINDIVNLIIEKEKLDPKNCDVDKLVKQVQFYLDPLLDYFNKISPSGKKELKGRFGAGANTWFTRAFQRAVANVREDYSPAGLKEYWQDQDKTHNAESEAYLREIKEAIKKKIEEKLRQQYGEKWDFTGIPKPIYKTAMGISVERNFENGVKPGDKDAITMWDCITLKDCKEIVTAGSHWTNLFATALTRPIDTTLATKDKKTEWIGRVESIANKLTKSSYSITGEEFEFIKGTYDWVSKW